jgi:RNA polymerase sigma-70 factor (ECF subfamily)
MAVDRAVGSTTETLMTGARQVRQPLDADSERWLAELDACHPRHADAVTRLQALLSRVARYELGRRRRQLALVSGPEFDDIADQVAGDVLLAILAKLEQFQGLSRFTTWAYKFVVREVSAKIAAHAWRRNPPTIADTTLEQFPDTPAREPQARLEQREQLAVLTAAIRRLTPRQREVFVAIALNGVSIDVLALELGSNRNALYKNLFDARRRLRQSLADAGYLIGPAHHNQVG